MNIVGVGAVFCMGCCTNIRNGTAIAAPAAWVSPPMIAVSWSLGCQCFFLGHTGTVLVMHLYIIMYEFSDRR